MAAPQLVSDESQVIENILTFNEEMDHPRLRKMIAYVRHWYAVQIPEKGWMFAPSKYIGYTGMNHKNYDSSFDDLDGRKTEHSNLKRWFIELEPSEKLAETLFEALRKVMAQHGKAINSLARIHVFKGHMQRPEGARKPPGSETWRITSDPGILAGKPCIRGMRIRVSDILEMLAHGATRGEILEDYPYLEDGDITAALEFAMGAVDHRLVKAA
jgi:uncharacterized protein (DUF433 family)